MDIILSKKNLVSDEFIVDSTKLKKYEFLLNYAKELNTVLVQSTFSVSSITLATKPDKIRAQLNCRPRSLMNMYAEY